MQRSLRSPLGGQAQQTRALRRLRNRKQRGDGTREIMIIGKLKVDGLRSIRSFNRASKLDADDDIRRDALQKY
jgi:hypothetical protein